MHIIDVKNKKLPFIENIDLPLSDALFTENVLSKSEIKLKMVHIACITVNLIKILPKSVNRSYLLSLTHHYTKHPKVQFNLIMQDSFVIQG